MQESSKPLPRAEWDFSSLETDSPATRYHACVWEHHREGLRKIGRTKIPPPWLAIASDTLPFIAGRKIAFRQVRDGYIAEPVETVGLFSIDWRFEEAEIVKCFQEWLQKEKSAGGRRDGHLAQLWRLSIYRLRIVEGLPIKEAQARLVGTRLESRGSKFFPRKKADQQSRYHQAFSDATRAASKEVEAFASVFRASPRLANFIPSLWKTSLARNTNK